MEATETGLQLHGQPEGNPLATSSVSGRTHKPPRPLLRARTVVEGCSCFSLSSHLSSCARNTQGPPRALKTIVAPTSTPLSLPITICLPFPPTTTCEVHTPVQIPYQAEEPAGRLRYESHSYGNSTVYFGISKK